MPEDVPILRDAPEKPSQTLGLYWRADGQRRALLLRSHGRGWISQDKADCDAARFALVDGYALASINYRLTDRPSSRPR